MIEENTLRRMVSGCLRQCIEAHGPITKDFIGSAQKRISNQILGHLENEFRIEALEKMKKKVRKEVEEGFVIVSADKLNQLEKGIRINRQGLVYWKQKALELETNDVC